LFGDMTDNTYPRQIYDNNHNDKIARGAIRGFQYTPYRKWQYLTSEIRGGIPRLERFQVAQCVVVSSPGRDAAGG
jgi:hypothetical protein